MPTNQLAPLVSTIRINLAGNSFQVILEMDGGWVDEGGGGIDDRRGGVDDDGDGDVEAGVVDSCNYEVETTQPSFLMVMIAQQLLPLISLLIL